VKIINESYGKTFIPLKAITKFLDRRAKKNKKHYTILINNINIYMASMSNNSYKFYLHNSYSHHSIKLNIRKTSI